MEKVIKRIDEWFDKYQPDLSNEEGQKLYKNLIQEELDETNKALKENDLVEFLDGCIDLFWVIKGYQHFGGSIDGLVNPFEIMMNNIYFDGYDNSDVIDSLNKDLINAVADSNYTKVLELQSSGKKKNKVIKGPNFVAPTEQIKNIILNYNIVFKY